MIETKNPLDLYGLKGEALTQQKYFPELCPSTS
jgi:hypothetical protein